MLGQPISMLIPEVVGFRLVDRLPEGRDGDRPRADDHRAPPQVRRRRQVRRVLRPGPRVPDDRRSRDARQHVAGVRRDHRDLPDRRDDARLPAPDRPRRRAREAGRGVREGAGPVPDVDGAPDPVYTATLELDLVDGRAEPGRARSGRRIACRCARRRSSSSRRSTTMLSERKPKAARRKPGETARRRRDARPRPSRSVEVPPGLEELDHGAVVVAAITSCTNTSNPSVMIGAGLLARNAVQARADGEAVGEDQPRARLAHRHRVLQGGRPARGTSPSSASTSSATAARPASATAARCPSRCRSIVKDKNLVVASVLSGNRNFEGRIQSQVRANYLASPPLVVAYALAGRMQVDLTTEPLGTDRNGAAGVPQGHLAERARDPGDDAAAR